MSNNGKMDEEKIKRYMTKCLWSVKNGNAYTMGDLDETDYQGITSVEDDKLLHKFFLYVAKSMLGEGKKKKVKKAVAEMKSSIDSWKEFIIAIDAMGEEATMDGMEEEEDESKNSRKKGSRKRKSSSTRSKSSKKARREYLEVDDEAEAEDEATFFYTRKEINAEKARFEIEKAKILDSLDDDYKARFGEICFVKWKNNPHRPVLLCSPYDVSFDSQARTQWLHMYEKTKTRPKSRTYLTYWYGSSESDCYTFQPKKTLTSFDEAKSKGILRAPKKLLEKTKPNASEQETLRAYEEYQADLVELQDERKPPFPSMEKYQSMEPDITPDFPDDDEEEEEEEEESPESEEEEEAMVEEEEEEPPKKKRGRPPKKTKEKPKAKRGRPPKKATKKKAPPREKEEPPTDNDDEMDFGEDEVSDSDEKEEEKEDEKDEFEEPPSEEEDDEELDGTYVAEGSKPKERKKKAASENGEKSKTKKKRKSKSETEEDGDEDEQPPKKKRGRPRKLKPKTDPKKNKLKVALRREQKVYDECKEKFNELHGQWLSAIKSKHAKKLVKVLQEVEKQAKHMSAPYIENYVAPFLKQSKPLLLKEDKPVEKSARNAVKAVHGEKKPKVPEGFEPKDDSLDESKPGNSDQTEQKKATATPTEKPAPPANAEAEEPKKVPEPKTDSNGHAGSAQAKLPTQQKIMKAEVVPESTRKTAPQARQVKSAEQRVQERTKPKKSFSLGGLMRAPRNGATTPVKASLSRQGSSAALDSQATTTTVTPTWLKQADPGVPSSLDDPSRKLALEFLVEAAADYLLSEKVDAKGFAQNLEHAIHAWSSDPKRRSGAYWDRLHSIVGAVCGNEDLGRVGKDLLKGKYQTAKQLASITEDELIGSFKETNPLL